MTHQDGDFADTSRTGTSSDTGVLSEFADIAMVGIGAGAVANIPLYVAGDTLDLITHTGNVDLLQAVASAPETAFLLAFGLFLGRKAAEEYEAGHRLKTTALEIGSLACYVVSGSPFASNPAIVESVRRVHDFRTLLAGALIVSATVLGSVYNFAKIRGTRTHRQLLVTNSASDAQQE